MSKKHFFLAAAVVVILIIAFFLNQSITKEVASGKGKNLVNEPESHAVQEKAGINKKTIGSECPRNLHVAYLINSKNNTILGDDDIMLKIANLGEQEWEFEVFVDDYSEGSMSLRPNETKTLRSAIITSWWRSHEEGADEDDEAVEEPGKKIFKVYFFVDGCGFTSGTLGIGFSSKKAIVTSAGESGGASSIEVTKSEQIHD
ncbi:MAG: hypothetical protein D6797_07250 [Bdellovibrio sp.]|nr:MAG: hypothetical protein D6797_07250 [Bdellovibrio sp.]